MSQPLPPPTISTTLHAVARAIGLWWGYPWCPIDPDDCGRVHDVETHLADVHRVAPWRRP